MAGIHKVTTGLTGLAVARHPHQTLKVLYNRILGQLEKMPADAGYRKHTSEIIKGRLQAVQAEANVAALEKRINCGQIEEVIKQAERELSLSRKMLEWKPWETLVAEAPKNQWKWPIA
ncbi:hypothetical protein EGW08_004806 [Elysia chlorotica]|uniref:NADH dehydrogenase [ubiquinone] 1 alpha subcomplex subunit 5 n=1 Tax=Elysia chlorotica TaxID=188477 RepID=A0A3S1HWC0_ELYCH|nr:hypothetical protein EGW08_004806 [Elysia chlorotica]